MNILQIKNDKGQWVHIPAIQGADGKSAYQVAVDNGFTGTEAEWLDSLKSAGQYAFEINGEGHLLVSYVGEDAPNLSIGADGHLYLNIT